MRKKILFCTNSRSELTTVLSMYKAAKSSKFILPMLMVGGTHFSERYGLTSEAILKRNIEIDYRANYYRDERDLASNLGEAVACFLSGLHCLDPDVTVITGDRIECLPLVTACLISDQVVAHVSGGDTTLGAFDNQIRDMVSKASHVHFVAMQQHAEKVEGLGENPASIFITGDPAIDVMMDELQAKADDTSSFLSDAIEKPYILCTFHPQTIESHDNELLLDNMLTALSEVPEFIVFTYPNGDPGSEQIIKKIELFVLKHKNSQIVKSFNGSDYYHVLSRAKLVVGNSSSPIWEGPTLNVPSVNIGIRQKGRVRAGNVFDVAGKSAGDIACAIRTVSSPNFLKKVKSIKNPYGNGQASKKIIKILEKIDCSIIRDQKVNLN